jgi:hypothetical protein
MDSQRVYHPQPSVPLNLDVDFDFNFDPALFPPPPPLPSSGDLFSPSETSDLLGFLQGFDYDIEADPSAFTPEQALQHQMDTLMTPHLHRSPPPYTNPHLNTAPEPSPARGSFGRSSPSASVGQEEPASGAARTGRTQPVRAVRQTGTTPATASSSSSSSSMPGAAPAQPQPQGPAGNEDGNKPLLSTPQKRLNHIMSEQKRRNAIRDGYAQLISLIAPAGSAHSIAMPSRGRPKGSGGRKGKTQGKSGVLFRAVEYVRFLEEGRDALLEEVLRLEALAGIKQEAR